eukprot:6434851-Pyramimonas_sp.AAC.1
MALMAMMTVMARMTPCRPQYREAPPSRCHSARLGLRRGTGLPRSNATRTAATEEQRHSHRAAEKL